MRTRWLLLSLALFTTACRSANDPVADKTFVALGGVKQYVEVTGQSVSLPLLLFLHGGPGWPATPMVRHFNRDLQEDFLVATWDQRGCGLSLRFDPSPGNLSLDQLVADAHELTTYLKHTYGKEKIYVLREHPRPGESLFLV